MRDPAAQLIMEAERVVRRLHAPMDDRHFLKSKLAQQWCERGDLIDFEILDDQTVAARRLPFVTQPHEWCDMQLHQAASLTLRLQREAVAAGYDLKDASAWNVIFDGCRPVFCDLLSFELLSSRAWRAAGQYARHFLLPLLVSRRRGLSVDRTFIAWRDGMPEEVARRLIGPSRFATRYWPLMSSPRRAQDPASATPSDSRSADTDSLRRFRASLATTLEWMLDGVAPTRKGDRPTVWGGYVEERPHYSDEALSEKRQVIQRWMHERQPRAVLDLGCNSGEFSRMAVAVGARVIAVDGDAGAVRRLCQEPLPALHPVLAPLDDLTGGRGWAGREFPGLPERLDQVADMTLVLALLHHLAIAAAVPLQAIADFVGRTSTRWVVVEWLSPADIQVRSLCERFARSPDDFSLDRQREAFERAGWSELDTVPLPGGSRVLALLTRRA